MNTAMDDLGDQIRESASLSAIELSIGRKDLDKARELLKSVANDPGRDAPDLVRLATALIEIAEGDLVRAEATLRSCIGTRIELLGRLNLSHLLVRLGRCMDAVEALAPVIKNRPTLVTPRLLAGDAFLKLGQPAHAMTQAHAAIAAAPGDSTAHRLLSLACDGIGSLPGALFAAEQAYLRRPAEPGYFARYMKCLLRSGDPCGALAHLERWRATHDAVTGEILAIAGACYSSLGNNEEARILYLAALEQLPQNPDIHQSLLKVLDAMGRDAEFDGYARMFHEQAPQDFSLNEAIASRLLTRGDIDGALSYFKRMIASCPDKNTVSFPVPEYRIRHDFEQLCLLKARGLLRPESNSAFAVLEECVRRLDDSKEMHVKPENAEKASLLGNALDAFHYIPEVDCQGDLLGFSNGKLLEKKYHEGKPKLIVIDDFLAQDALRTLRKFCVEATIWKRQYRNGYLGAFLSQGFLSLPLLRIAVALRLEFPAIFGNHGLTQAWAFKYDQRMSGINLHADFAAVNVNFWITPDEANLEKESGGMIVYDVPAPKSWSLREYNQDSQKIRIFLDANRAMGTKIPYKENRCVIFDSTLFHATDTFRFAPGYENRRVNVTLLFGEGLNTR